MKTPSIASIALQKFLDAGGAVAQHRLIYTGIGPDWSVDVFTVFGRVGTYISDNGGLSWSEEEFGRVCDLFQAGDSSAMPEFRAVASI